jgi:phosphopantothenoylcysteine decarboxylase / phosphopantothenate---cysteine ligase
MKILITAGPTHEPIDPVRFIGNRSSGKMGAALAAAAIKAGHSVTLILGPVAIPMPGQAARLDVQTAAEMLAATLSEFPKHDLLILAAAVADYTPKIVQTEKIARKGDLVIELQPTADIAAAAGKIKRPHQRTVGFSLESVENLDRARQKMAAKNLDLIVHNPTGTIASDSIQATLIFAGGRSEALPSASKSDFADMPMARAASL